MEIPRTKSASRPKNRKNIRKTVIIKSNRGRRKENRTRCGGIVSVGCCSQGPGSRSSGEEIELEAFTISWGEMEIFPEQKSFPESERKAEEGEGWRRRLHRPRRRHSHSHKLLPAQTEHTEKPQFSWNSKDTPPLLVFLYSQKCPCSKWVQKWTMEICHRLESV